MTQLSICRGVHTSVFSDGENATAVVYRGTKVARKEGSRVTLNSGGWRTHTTKTRMNQFANEHCGSRFVVYQQDGEWFVEVRDLETATSLLCQGMTSKMGSQ